MSLPLAAQGPVSAAIGAESTSYRLSRAADGFRATSPAEHLRVRFTRTGVAVTSSAGRVALALRAVGLGGDLRGVETASPSLHGGRVVYVHRGLSEWYANGPLGLEQGFIVRHAPVRTESGALTLHIAVDGNLRPALRDHGQLVSLSRAGGGALGYGDLLATDAVGHSLRSSLAVDGRDIVIRVDARGARYPVRIDPMLAQQAKLTAASGTEIGAASLGERVAVSADGNTALVSGEGDSNYVGAAWVFTRSGSTWTQQAKLTAASGSETGDGDFGSSVALSADGNTALIGGYNDNSNSGAVWVFTRSGLTWTQQQKLTAPSTVSGCGFGWTAALSGDGSTALIGAKDCTSAFLFTRSGSTFAFLQQLPNYSGFDDVALSQDGSTALIGSSATGSSDGAAFVYTRSGSSYTQQQELTAATGTEVKMSEFGWSVALSADGNTALVGGNSQAGSPAWVFARAGSTWTQQATLNAGSTLITTGEFTGNLALSSTGTTALVGVMPVGSQSGPGKALMFTRSGSNWTQSQTLTPTDASGNPDFGNSVALDAGADTAVIGGVGDNSRTGAAWVMASDSDLSASIALTGSDGQPFTGGANAVGKSLVATVTLTNSSTSQSITGITVNPPLSVSPAATLVQTGGPSPAPPATLAPGQSASYTIDYTVQSNGKATLSLSASGTENSATVSASASTLARLGQPIGVAVSFVDSGGVPIPSNTIKLPDTDNGEVPRDLTAVVTLTNRSSLTQTNLSLNGPLIASFHQVLPTQGALPISVNGGPTPAMLPATLAPGASTKIEYGVHVTANGVFDLSSQVLSSDSGGGTNVSSGVGTLTANPTAVLLLKLHAVSDIRRSITPGQPVLLAGTLTNLSNIQPLDLLPIAPVPTEGTAGNVGGGLVMDSAQSELPDGVRPPLAGKLKPSDTREVEVELDTAPVPGTRATVTYEPSGFLVNADGTETKLTSDQIRLGEGTSPIQLSFDTRDPVHTHTARSIAGNFAQGAFIAMSEWYLNGLHAAYDIARHPIDAQISGLKHVAGFVVSTPTAIKQSVGLLNSLYLLNKGLKDMTAGQKAEFVSQLLQDYEHSIPGGITSGIQKAAEPVLEKFANAMATGDYDQVAQMSGYGLGTGGGVVADTLLTDFAFQKLALLAKAPAGATVAESELGRQITLAQTIKDAKVEGKAGAALIGEDGKKIGAGVNLLQNYSLLENVYGLTKRQITLLRDFCESNGITVALRSRSRRAAELIKRGIAVAKNLVIKLKGVNELDVHFLGYAQTDLNTVVWAEPISRAQLERNIARYRGGVDENLRYLIEKRYQQRIAEWKNIDYRQKISTWDVSKQIKLEFDGKGSGVGELDKARTRYRRFELADNPAIVHDKRGNDRYYKVFKVATSESKLARLVSVTQDVDLVAVLGGNQSILPPALRAKAYEYLEDILGIEHPDTIPWVKNGEVAFEAKTKLLVDHLEGGEALATFGADGSVRTSFFNPHLTVFDQVTKGGTVVLDGAYNDPTAPIAIGALGKLLTP